MPSLKQTILASASAFQAVASQTVISLVGNDWTLSNDALNISIPASLPSQAHLDLYAQQVIGDPFHDLNDFDLRWIALSNWTYTSASISGLSTDDAATSTWLRFDGLDTFASIHFCNEFVAYTDNQFRQYWFDVTNHLTSCRESDRIISIEFGSAPLIANATASAPGQETWPASVQWTNEFASVNYIRKEQSDFGWDWGPAFAPAGPWQPAYIVQLGQEQVHVRNIDIDIYREGQLPLIPPDQSKDWVVNASLDYFGNLPADATLKYTLTDAANKSVSLGCMSDINRTESSITGLTTIAKNEVDLWWPNGLGEQPLYHLTIDLVSSSGVGLGCVTKRIGFRTIVLNLTPISEEQISQGIAPGNNWNFQVNGHEFYALGSNFIPPDPFWPNVTVGRMAQLLDSVIEGNQNMLRVWSSGAYSPDYFYDLADERGILLWSEFEFSDHLYPVDPYFLENVREEAEYNVRRVNHHPSLALWAGGNELESLMLEIVNRSNPDDFPRYQAEYEQLFIDVLTPAVFANSRSISYTPSSTGNGWLMLDYSIDPLRPFTERYNNKTAGSIYGDTDYYNYDPTVLGNYSLYPVGRFSNEFGFHSMPSLQSWRQQVSEDQLYFNSTVTTLRDHHLTAGGLNTSNFDASGTGQYQMTEAVYTWYPIPHKTDRLANFTAWIYATQVFQADLYTSEIQFYRRGSGMPERQLGSLYWQLEDQWVAPTWAGIEYDGRWKMLHYAAKDIYEPIIIAPFHNASTGELTAYVTSSLWDSVSGTASFTWYDWSGNRLQIDNATSTATFTVGALNTTRVLYTNTSTLLSDADGTNAVLRLQVTAQGRLPNTNITREFRHENWFHAAPLNKAQLVDPGLSVAYSDTTDNFTVSATTGVAAWVFLDYPSGAVLSFDSNAFWLAKGEERQISYKVKSDTTGGRWKDGVTVQSIWNLTLST